MQVIQHVHIRTVDKLQSKKIRVGYAPSAHCRNAMATRAARVGISG
jgi:hypothetical protein